MDVSLFDYDLPQELIAQTPAQKRDESRLLVVDRKDASLHETTFHQIADYFQPGDVLVLNDTYVIPARLHGRKEPGSAMVEVLLLKQINDTDWEVITNRSSRLKPGTSIRFSDHFHCEIIEKHNEGKSHVRFYWQGNWDTILQQHGEMPLPPYIQRPNGQSNSADHERYQTIYAKKNNALPSVAAPTAGLHFTEDVLHTLRKKGVEICTVTLQVGLDTFLPLRVDTVEEHRMHNEKYCISEDTASILNHAIHHKKRIIAGGTTSARVLESAVQNHPIIQPRFTHTGIFIYPGYQFKIVQSLITNFHLPKSTLIMMVSAIMGNELRKNAYLHAVQNHFRFYSYGDAMLIL